MTTDNKYDELREAYIRSRKVADQARENWSAYLPNRPEGLHKPALSGNIDKVYNDLVQAEDLENSARDALFAFLRSERTS